MRVDRDQPVCIKYHALSRWVARQLGGIEHERRVAAIASTLFDLTVPLHHLHGEERRLLHMAAMVHDVGRAVDDDNHPQEGAKMVRRQRDLPLTLRRASAAGVSDPLSSRAGSTGRLRADASPQG